MVQVKKPETREAILSAAHELFSSKGYIQTTLTEIAKAAGVTTSNIYNYFPSKLDVFYEIITPWYADRLEQLDREVDSIDDNRNKLEKVLRAIFLEIPMWDNFFANNLIQAVSTRPADATYSRSMLFVSEKKVSTILRKILPKSCQWVVHDDAFTHFLMMAFDGFAMHARLRGPERQTETIVDTLCTLILGPAERPSAADGEGRPQRVGGRVGDESAAGRSVVAS